MKPARPHKVLALRRAALENPASLRGRGKAGMTDLKDASEMVAVARRRGMGPSSMMSTNEDQNTLLMFLNTWSRSLVTSKNRIRS